MVCGGIFPWCGWQSSSSSPDSPPFRPLSPPLRWVPWNFSPFLALLLLFFFFFFFFFFGFSRNGFLQFLGDKVALVLSFSLEPEFSFAIPPLEEQRLRFGKRQSHVLLSSHEKFCWFKLTSSRSQLDHPLENHSPIVECWTNKKATAQL